MKRHFLLPAACVALAFGAACAGRDNPVLARFDDREIRAEDFLDQLRKITPDQRPDLATPEAREEFLLNIVRKEIMLAEARARGLDKDAQHVMSDEDLMIMTAQPLLMEHLRASRPEPPPAEIEALAGALAFRFRMRAVYGPDSEILSGERQRLEAGTPWAKVEEEWMQRRAQYHGGGDAGVASLESLPPELRNVIAALEPGGFTPVVEQQSLYYIYHLVAKEPAPEDVTAEWRRERAVTMWQNEWEMKAYEQLVEDARKGAGYDENEEFLTQVSERFRAEGREGIQPGAVVDMWPTFTEAEMSTAVASWQGQTFTLGDLLYRLEGIPDGLRPDLGTIQGLEITLQGFTGRKFMVSEFGRLGLKMTPEQAWSLQRSSERRMLRRVRRELVAGAEVGEDEIHAFYDARAAEFTGPQEYHARAIVAPDSTRAQGYYELLRAGADFAHLAEGHSVHAASRAKGGDLGWIGPHTYEDLFMPLRGAQVNANMPPVPAPGMGGWVILRLEEHRGRRMLEYPEARDLAYKTLLEEAEDRKLTQWLDAEIAKRVKLHADRARKLVIPAELLPVVAGAGADTAEGGR